MNNDMKAALMATLMQAGGASAMTHKNVEVLKEGAQIIIPEGMENSEAIEWLKRKIKEEEETTAVYYEIPCSPLDGAVALQRAIADKYGWANGVPTPGFFGDSPPLMIGVPVSPTEKVNVPYGRIEIPSISGFIETHIKTKPVPMFLVTGEVKKKHADAVRELVTLAEKFLKDKSIYKNKAIRLSFDWERRKDSKGNLGAYDPTNDAPKFIELNGYKEDDLIFGDQVVAALTVGLFTPIEYSDACRKFGVPLKRGVLLHGPYGTGKTMTAYVTALKAVRNNWTFIYLDDVRDLEQGLRFAAQYAPAVIFSEDIDRAVTGERSADMDSILNVIDGVDTKGAEIITVLTTNHVDQINPAMLRPGRLDTLVEVLPPDAKAAQRLVALYSRGLLEEGADLTAVGVELEGKIPAVIREVTERAKIAAIYRTGGGDIEGKVLAVDMIAASQAMKNHSAMFAAKDKVIEPRHQVYVVTSNDDTAEATAKLKSCAN